MANRDYARRAKASANEPCRVSDPIGFAKYNLGPVLYRILVLQARRGDAMIVTSADLPNMTLKQAREVLNLLCLRGVLYKRTVDRKSQYLPRNRVFVDYMYRVFV